MDDEAIVGVSERPDHHLATYFVAVDRPRRPSAPTPRAASGASAAPRVVGGDRLADEEQAGENVEPVARPGGADQRSDLAGGQVGEHVRPESVGDGGERVAGVVERLAGASDVVRARRRPQR